MFIVIMRSMMFSVFLLMSVLCTASAETFNRGNLINRAPRRCFQLKCGSNFRCFQPAPNRDARCVPTKKCSPTRCKVGQRCINGGPGQDFRCQRQTCQSLKCFSSNQICQVVRTGAFCRRSRVCANLRCAAKRGHCIPGRFGKDAKCVPGCKSDEIWNRCGGCDGNCQDPNFACPGRCSPFEAKCRCKVGKVRGPGGNCVFPAMCAGFIPIEDWYPKCSTIDCKTTGRDCWVNHGQMQCKEDTDSLCNCNANELCVLRNLPCSGRDCPLDAVCTYRGLKARCNIMVCRQGLFCKNTAAGPKCIPTIQGRQQVTADSGNATHSADAYVFPAKCAWKQKNQKSGDL